jgi:tRNA (pseudouridine54-N1)-methyltransferase
MTLRKGGRLDVVYQCILFSLFTSGAIRRDVIFHVILGGSPKPPIHMTVDGRSLKDVRTDERTWEEIMRKVLSGGTHPGISVDRKSLQALMKNKANILVLEEKGMDVSAVNFGDNPVFVLGDQVGLPKNDEKFLLREGKKVSLGKRRYLAATCIDIINYLVDLRNEQKSSNLV